VMAICLTFLGRMCEAAAPEAAPADNPAAPRKSAAVDLPAFQPGMWEYTRTTQVTGARSKPESATVRKCSDPNREMREKLARMKQKGCQVAPMTRQDNHYRSSFSCPMKGASLRMSDVITVKNAASYEYANETHYGERHTHTTIVAHRVGECSPPAAHSPNPPQ
jgi:hypothetical protein